MNTIAASRSSRAAPALWMLLTQVLALVSLAAWVVVAGFSFVAAGPANPEILLPAPLLWALWIYPVVPLACTVAAWRAFRRGDTRRAVTWSTVQLVAVLPLLAWVWYMASPV